MAKVRTCALYLFAREQAIVDKVGERYGLKAPQAIRYIINDWSQRVQPPPPPGPDSRQIQLFNDDQS